MATSYTGLRVQDTYNAIIKIGDNSNLTSTPKLLSDGLGNDSPLYLSGTRLGIGISPAYQFHTSGNAKIGGDVIISGDLTVNGDLTYLNVTDLAVEDPLIKLAKDNTANTLDIGLFGKYVATGTKYKGFFNDASDDKFKLFIGTTVEPTTTVDTSATGYTKGNLVIGNLEATGGDFSDTVYIDDHLEIENSSGYGYIELGGSSGGYIDLKGPFSNDFDLRIFTGGTNSQINAISGALDITANSGIDLQYQGSNKLTVISTGIDVTGNLFVSGGIKDSDGDLGTSGQLLSSTGTGTNWIDFEADTAKRLEIDVKNVHGGTLAKGTVVHAEPTGTLSGNVIEVVAADANVAANMPAIGVLNEALLDDEEGKAVMFGTVQGIDTSSFSVGDELYVSATAGEFTATKPTATTEQVQKIAIVVKSHASNGLIKVFGAGRSNDVPNLLTRDITIDNADFYFGNADQIRMGDSIGLRLQHTGSHSYIDGEIGNIYIRAEADNSDIVFQADNGSGGNANYLTLDGGDERIYVNRLMRFEDDVELRLGENNDIRLYHNSTSGNNNIENHTGDLYVTNYADDSSIIFRSDNGIGDVTEYFKIDGNINRNVITVTTQLNDNTPLVFGDAAGRPSIKYDSTASELFIDGTTKFLDTVTIVDTTGASQGTILKIENSGDYGSSQDLHIYNQYNRDVGIFFETLGGTNYIWQNSGSTGDHGLYISAAGIADTDITIKFNQDHSVTIPNGAITASGRGTFNDLELTSGADHLTITESSGDWTFNNAQQDNGITIYDGTGGIDFKYNGTAQMAVNTNGVEVFNYYFTVDTNLLYVDAANNLVGIGKTPSTYKLDVNGKIASNDYIIAGLGNGGVALTHNDGEGNANVTFNHVSGIPEQNGNSFRIRANTDSSSSATMRFEIKEGVTADTAVDTIEVFRLMPDGPKVRATGGGILSLQRDDASIVDGNPIGRLRFSGDDPVDDVFNMGAEIRGEAAGTWATDNYPTELQFYTTSTNTLDLALKLDSSQDATFAGNIKFADGAARSIIGATNQSLIINSKPNSGTEGTIFQINGVDKLSLLNDGNATFAGDVTVSGGDIILGGTGRIQGIDTVTAGTDAVNKNYVDNNTVDGSGTANYIPKWSDADTLGDSSIYQSGSQIGIDTTTLNYKLNVAGTVFASGDFIVDTFGDTYRIGADSYTTDQTSGVMIRPADEVNPASGMSMFTVRSGGGSPRLFVEHDGTTGTTNNEFTIGASSTRANGNILLRATADSYISGGGLSVGTTVGTGNFLSYISASRQLTHNGNGGDLSIISDNNTTPVMYIKGTGTADLVSVFDNTTEVFKIEAGGNVGISTTSPQANLHIEKNDANPVLLVKASGQTSSTAPYAKLVLAAGSASGFDVGSNIMGYRTADFSSAAARSTGLKFGVLQNNVAKDAMWITEAQRVGIGTDSPSNKLVVSDNNTTGLEIAPNDSNAEVVVLAYDRADIAYRTINFNASDYIWRTSGAEKMNLAADGDLKIARYLEHLNDSNSYLGWSANDDFRIVTGGRELLRLDEGTDPDILNFMTSTITMSSGGAFTAALVTSSGDVVAFSDKRLKTNIKTIDNGLEKISKLRGVSYNRIDIDDKSNKIGVIAQEVKEVLPEVVNYDNKNDKYGVDYGKMAGVFIEAIKELKAEVDTLKKEIKQLKK